MRQLYVLVTLLASLSLVVCQPNQQQLLQSLNSVYASQPGASSAGSILQLVQQFTQPAATGFFGQLAGFMVQASSNVASGQNVVNQLQSVSQQLAQQALTMVTANSTQNIGSCGIDAQQAACGVLQTAAAAGSKLILLPWDLIGLLSGYPTDGISTAEIAGTSPVAVASTLCVFGTASPCIPASVLQSLSAMANQSSSTIFVNQIVGTLAAGDRNIGGTNNVISGGGVDLVCADSQSSLLGPIIGFAAPECSDLTGLCSNPAVGGLNVSKCNNCPSAVYGISSVRCEKDSAASSSWTVQPGAGPNTQTWPTLIPPLTAPNLPTFPTLSPGVDNTAQQILTVVPTDALPKVQQAIQQYYGSFEKVLRSVFDVARQTQSMGSDIGPLNFLNTTSSVLQNTFRAAWQARLIVQAIRNNRTSTTTPTTPQPAKLIPPLPIPSSWSSAVGSIMNLFGRRRRQASSSATNNACSTAVSTAACSLLDLNNNGQIFLSPWVWEDLMMGTSSTSTSSPLTTVVALCLGEQAQSYNGTAMCVSANTLQSAATVAKQVFQQYASPAYVSAILTGVEYMHPGLDSMKHFSGIAVDFLCGPSVYAADAQIASQTGGGSPNESCDKLLGWCYLANFNYAYQPAADPSNGCGQTWWPIPATHCSSQQGQQ